MTPSISPISAQALNLLPVIALPLASPSNKGWLMRWRGDGQVYENKTGTAWTRVSDGSSAPTTAIANDVPFTGNPANLDTAEEMAAAIQSQAGFIAALQAKMTRFDSDNDDRVDAENQQSNTYTFPAAQPVWTINHNLGRRPVPLVRDLSGQGVSPDDVQYPTTNTMIIYFGAPQAGSVELT